MFFQVAIAIVILLSFKFILNLIRFLGVKKYLGDYFDWLDNSNWKMVENKHKVIELFTNANLDESYVPRLEPISYDKDISYKEGIFTAFPSKKKDIASLTVGLFHEAIGVYRSRMLETFNPLYWIQAFLFLPRNALQYIGIQSGKTITKILQLVWWTIDFLLVAGLTLYSDEISEYLGNLF